MMTSGNKSNKWFTCLKPNPHARLRLFCFPYAGGGAMVYRAWPALMPGDVEVCMARLPGREERLRETPLASVAPLVEAIGAEIQPLLDRPSPFLVTAWAR